MLLDAKIIVPSISQYAAPCMVVPRKCRDPSIASIHEVARLVINYKKLNKNLIPRECEKPNSNGTLVFVGTVPFPFEQYVMVQGWEGLLGD